jgi:hypothetical protein
MKPRCLKIMNPRTWLLLALIFAAAVIGESHAATRLALVGSGDSRSLENVLDAATVLLSKDADLQLLDRVEVGRVLREQELSLAGLVDAEHAVKAGQLLHVDLFAVLEGSLTNETEGSPTLGLVVFDAKTGVRYADSALLASNAVSAASVTAGAVRAAVAKAHRNPQELHMVGLLLVRNADLPRQFDGLCDSVGLLLERELTASPGIAVLERRRLEQVNKERGVAPDAEGNRLLSSLRLLELDVSQDSAGLRGNLVLLGASGTSTDRITASVPTRNAAALAHLLAEKIEQFLNAPADGFSASREAEADRFHREYVLLLQHHDYASAVRSLDAALALAPAQAAWAREMVLLLPDAAIELIDPGGQNHSGGLLLRPQPSAENVAAALVLGHRGADLLLDLSREAASHAKTDEPIPEVFSMSYRDRLFRLLDKLADVKSADSANTRRITELAEKERTLRMEVVEPFLRRRVVDQTSFSPYASTLRLWLSPRNWRPFTSGSLTDLNEQRRRDDVQVVGHWVETSHKVNPPDGSGNYFLISDPWFFRRYADAQVEEFRKTLEQDQDPVIRIYARAGRVAASMVDDAHASEKTLAAEREFRLYAQDLLVHSEAAKPGPLRNHVWGAIERGLRSLQNYEPAWRQYQQEYLEACRFAFAQQDIQPALFNSCVQRLDNRRHRNVPEELEVVNSALELILKHPDAYPAIKAGATERGTFIRELQQKREQLTAELAGQSTRPPQVSLWQDARCLLDLVKPMAGRAWLFRPLVQDGQVFALTLSIKQWGAPEDYLQLVKVPLAGGSLSFLGQARVSGIDWGLNGPEGLKRGPAGRLATNVMTDWAWVHDVRAACIGADCYFAATSWGVLMFPRNGGPVARLCTTNGLPSDEAHSLAFLDGTLFIGAGELRRAGYLAAYDLRKREISVLASSRRSEHLSPLDDQPPFCAFSILAEPPRHRLLLAVSSANLPSKIPRNTDPSMGIWTYVPGTGKFDRLASLYLPVNPFGTHDNNWAGLTDSNTLVLKGTWTNTLFDLSNNALRPVYGSTAQPPATDELWTTPIPGQPGMYRIATAPFLVMDGWFYSAMPFERRALSTGLRQEISPLRPEYKFEPKESLQLLDDGKHVLAADQYSIWLLEPAPKT